MIYFWLDRKPIIVSVRTACFSPLLDHLLTTLKG